MTHDNIEPVDWWKYVSILQRQFDRGVFPIFRMQKFSGGSFEYMYDYVGVLGAVSFNLHFPSMWEGVEERLGGVEYHWRYPDIETSYFDPKKPHRTNCNILGDVPCWHDGTSLWASEHWVPIWQSYSDKGRRDEWVRDELRHAYTKAFQNLGPDGERPND